MVEEARRGGGGGGGGERVRKAMRQTDFIEGGKGGGKEAQKPDERQG